MASPPATDVEEARELEREVRRERGRITAARARLKEKRQQLDALKERWERMGVRLTEEDDAPQHETDTPHTAREEHSDQGQSARDRP
jgi:hypothetical protein